MEFRRLVTGKDPLFNRAFALYAHSFPEHERRLPGHQEAVMPDGRYHFDVILEDGALSGILLWWECTGYAYIEHFAMNPLVRGRGMGGAALDMFCREHPSVILEIDPPVGFTSASRELFYLRHGFKRNRHAHLHPPYRPCFQPHELVVLSFPAPLDEEGRRLFERELREICGSTLHANHLDPRPPRRPDHSGA